MTLTEKLTALVASNKAVVDATAAQKANVVALVTSAHDGDEALAPGESGVIGTLVYTNANGDVVVSTARVVVAQ